MAHVQDSIEKVYANFEDYETGPEGGEVSTEFLDTAVATKINDFIKPKTSDHAEGLDGDSFKSLDEFSILEKTSPAIDANLAEKLTKEKLAKVQSKYLRPENCTNLVAPKINKQIWQQFLPETMIQLSRRHSPCSCQMLYFSCVTVQMGIREIF